MVVIANIFSGLVIGFVLGIVLQRGSFCFNSGFQDTLRLKDYTIVKALGVALVIEMVGFQLLSDVKLVKLYPRGLYWGANMLGGFMFGVGMVIAGGCILGSTYRTGEGMVGSALAVLGIGIGGAATLNYTLAPMKDMLQSMTKVQVNGLSPTIPITLGVSPWFLILPISAAFLFLAQRSYRDEKLETRDPIALLRSSWPWWLSGITIGAVGVISYPVAEAAGRSTPLAMTGGYIGLLAILVYRNWGFLGWEQAMVFGAIVGAALAALLAREWRMSVPPARMLGQSLLGGLVMGVGAVLGDGCNITTILIGVPLFSLGGILAGTFTIFGCWTAAYLMFG